MKKIEILALGLGLALSGCSTQEQQQIATVACTADNKILSASQAGEVIAMVANPAVAGEIAALNAADALVHPAITAACALALPGSVPVGGTVNVAAVPVAPPVSQTTLAILPVSTK